MRRTFEIETGSLPLETNSTSQAMQRFSGSTQAYYDRFLLWATQYLGLEDQAPASIKGRLSRPAD
jgi:hypothetical protein